MKGSELTLKMLELYEVKHVFGLPGETTIPLYVEWHNFPNIEHVMARDERNACFMADAYAKVSFKPGLCEAPSVGATHIVPAVVEAFKGSTPLIAITTDIPLHLERRNMLTGFDQTIIFKGITKESMTITKVSEIPHTIRRAFRLATTGKLGPVHIRIPQNVLEGEEPIKDIYVQRDFTRYPGHRFIASLDRIGEAIKLILSSGKPVIVCGQGVLYSQAWDEVVELAEMLSIPVGTTITGKGSFPEVHPLSIGVVGSRGGTSFSNKALNESDLVFYIGCNTDYTATDSWTLPSLEEDKKIIHLDISEAEVGNNYPVNVALIGDAKATLKAMIQILKDELSKSRKYDELPRIREIRDNRRELEENLKKYFESDEKPINPLRFIKELSRTLRQDYILVCDPGVSAIYTSAFFKVEKPGRRVIFNYSMGALGYAIPASIGAYFASPSSTVVALTGDGSFGFTAGELETISRLDSNIKIVMFNNGSHGWIKASFLFKYGPKYFATEFKPIEYVKIAEGFGLDAYRIEDPKDLEPTLRKALNSPKPAFIEVLVEPEDRLVPPVPSWVKRAKELGLKYIY